MINVIIRIVTAYKRKMLPCVILAASELAGISIGKQFLFISSVH